MKPEDAAAEPVLQAPTPSWPGSGRQQSPQTPFPIPSPAAAPAPSSPIPLPAPVAPRASPNPPVAPGRPGGLRQARPPLVLLLRPLGSRCAHRGGRGAGLCVGTASSAWLAPGPLPNSSPAFLSNEALIGSRLRFPSPLLRALQSQRCRAIRLRFGFFFFFFNMAELFWKGQDRYMTGFLKNPRLRLSDGAFSSGFAQYTSLGSDRLEQLLLIIDASFPLAHYSKDFCVF